MIIKSKEAMGELAKEVLLSLRSDLSVDSGDPPPAKLLLLSGDLGAGKTTFVQALAKELGVRERVTSPTFVIQKEYSTKDNDFKRLIHIDAYRLGSFSDLELLGWDEYSNSSDTIIALEWPERVEKKSILNGRRLVFNHLDGGREVLFEHQKDR